MSKSKMKDEYSSQSDFQDESSVEEKESNENQKSKRIYRIKKLKIVQQVCDTYSVFLKVLLGQEPSKQDLEILNKNLGTFSYETQETQLPDAILKFPNPDYKSQSPHSISSLEAFNSIKLIVKSHFEGLTKKIFLKACEGAIQLLEDKKFSNPNKQKLYRQKVRRENQFVEFVNTEDSRRMETTIDAYEESQHQSQKDKLILKLSNKLTGNNYQFNSDSNVINEALEIDYNMLKFLPNKKVFKGGYLILNNGNWIRSKKDVRDFSSLVRNIITIILNSLGYYIDSFLSENGKFIFCSIYATEVSLKLQAETLELQKILNIQFIDLFSFEPLDKSYRPLRLNNRLWKPHNYKNISPMLKYLRKSIIDLIQSIDFKRIAREVNQSGINQKLFHYGIDQYDDQETISDSEWYAFYSYLIHLERNIREARSSFKIKSDIAALINQQITPLELYKRRRLKADQHVNFSQTIIDYQTQERIQNNKIDILRQEMLNTIDEYKNIFHLNQVPYTKLIKVLKKEQLANTYLQIFKQSLKVANMEQKSLYSLWDRLHLSEPVNIKLKYSNPSYERSLHHQHCQFMCWKKYQLNQGEKITIFQSSERLRLAQMKIYSTFNVQFLKEKQLLKGLFCLHDNFELYGLYYSNYDNLEKNRDQFYQEKLFDVSSQLKFDFLKPMSMKFGLLCEYFGEQVASYFYFLCFFSQMLLHQILLGLLYYGISILITQIMHQQILKIIYQLIQLQLTSISIAKWEQQIKIFEEIHTVNNQNDIDFTPNQQQGEPKRSLINDQMNVLTINELDQVIRGVLSTMLFLLIQIVCSAIFIALYFLCEQAKIYVFTNSSNQNVEIILVAILHLSINKLYSYQFSKVIQKLVDYEQLRSVIDIKQSYNLKLYSFLIIQQIGPLLILRFFNYSFKLVCENDSCENYIGYYFLTYVAIKSVEKLVIFLFNFYSLRKQSVFIYKFEQNDINCYIESQSKRASNIKNEYANSIEENLQQNMVEITILTYFAYIYPITYLMYWVLFVVQIYADKAQYLYYYQRPWPQSHCFNKVWNNILKYIIVSSIIIASFGFSNSDLFQQNQKILVFVSFMLLSFTLNFLCQIWYSGTPSFLVKLILRQKYLIKSTIDKFKKKAKTVGQYEVYSNKKMPLYKIFGSRLIMDQGEFETLSSDSDLEKYFQGTPQNLQEPILQDNLNLEKTLGTTIGGSFKTNKKKPLLVRSSSFYERFILQKNFQIDNQAQKGKLFRIVDQLITYHKAWNFLRIHQRNYYFPRKKRLVQNLDDLKFQVIKSSLKRQKEFGKEIIYQQYRRKIIKLKDSKEEHDKKELELIEDKIQKHCHKYKWLNAQKFVFIKIKKAVWFNGFRKSFLKLNSKLFLEIYLKKQVNTRRNLKQEFEFEIFENNNISLDFKGQSIINILEHSQEHYQNSVKYIPLASGIFNIKYYSCAHKKSEKFVEIIEKLRDTYIFDEQKKQIQSIMMEYFEEECFPIPEINLIKQLNETSWLAKISEQKFPQLVQFIQVKHGQTLQLFQALNSDRGVSYVQGENHVRLSNFIDKIDDFYVKGYSIIIYNEQPMATLETVIKQRKKYRLYYSNDEIYSFFYDNLLLLLRQKHGDIQTKNYLLCCNSYILVNTNNCDQASDLEQLAKVLIQMMTLTQQKQALEALEQIEKHDLYQIILQMLNGQTTIEELLSKIKYQDKFQESFIIINQEITENQQLDFQEYLQITLHKSNFLLRIKHFEKGLFILSQFENILHKQIYKQGNNALEAFQFFIIANFTKYILNSSQMQEITCILMVFFIKLSMMTQQRKYQIIRTDTNVVKQSQFQQQFEQLVFCLEDLIQNLDLILIQLQLNINLEQISKQEAEAMFGMSKNKTGHIIKLKHFERIRLINTLRLNQRQIENLFQFRKTIRRFQNQLNVLDCISQYYLMHLPRAQKIIDDCIDVQMELVRSKNKLELTKEMKDLSPDLYNYNQMSPKENKMDAFTFQVNQSMTELCEQDPTYFHQLLYYYYLQIIIWHDIGEKDIFIRKARSFLFMQIQNSPSYKYFQSTLKGLIQDEIPYNYIKEEQQCEIGKFEIIKLTKWLEETYQIQSEYILSNNYRLLWKQIINLRNIKQTLLNRQILQEQLDTEAVDLKSQLSQIRAIHLILHLDNYFPLNYRCQQLNYSPDIFDMEIFQNSYITKLQNLHHSISIPSNSWFHTVGMFQFRLYHIQSIIFTFSHKHFENNESETSMKDLAKNALGLFQLQKDNRDILMKIQQILLEDYVQLLDKNQSKTQLHQIIYSTILLKLNQNNRLSQIMKEITEYTKGVQNSILFLMILQALLQTQQIKQMSFLIYFAKKLISMKSPIFFQMHENFENDLSIFQLMISSKSFELDFIQPYDSLFRRQRVFKFFSDYHIYSRYLIYHCLLLQNYDTVIEYIEDNLNLIQDIIEFDSLKTIYENYLIYLKISLGTIRQDKAQKMLLTIHSQVQIDNFTLYQAINKYILVRVYINLKDYHVALKFSEELIQFIYWYESSKQINLESENNFKHKKKVTSMQEFLRNQFVKKFQKIRKYTQEPGDIYYNHLIDDDFICNVVLDHLEILCNINTIEINIFQLLNFSDYIKNEYLEAYFYKIIAQIMITKQFQKNLIITDHELLVQVRNIIQEKKILLFESQTSLQQHNFDEHKTISKRLARLNYKQIVFQKLLKKPSQEDINFLAQLAAKKSFEYFQEICKKEKILNHLFLIQLYLLLGETNLIQFNFSEAVDNCDLAEEQTSEIFGKNLHPQTGYYLFQKIALKLKLKELQFRFLNELDSMKIYNIYEMSTIALLLLQENKFLNLQIGYYYKTFDIQSFQNNIKDLIKINISYCRNLVPSLENPSIENIFQEIIKVFPSLDYVSMHDYLSASHHFIYLDDENEYRKKISEAISKKSYSRTTT